MPRGQAVTRAPAATRGWPVAQTRAGTPARAGSRDWTRGWPVAQGRAGTPAWTRGWASAATPPTKRSWISG
jgi:hypothetical protein